MALQKGQRLREAGQFEVAAVGQIKSAGDTAKVSKPCRICAAWCWQPTLFFLGIHPRSLPQPLLELATHIARQRHSRLIVA
ncbi:hypothetical protein XANMN_08540 [Xanthomonas phaseoli pv. manihotis str. CIO151]|nr:hypothetical protein XANMN_08540 [Xanthomonas phaseoli pv. manihotis str. CIO151]